MIVPCVLALKINHGKSNAAVTGPSSLQPPVVIRSSSSIEIGASFQTTPRIANTDAKDVAWGRSLL